MIRRLFFGWMFLNAFAVSAQHCPWDCSGLLMLKTDITPAGFKQLNCVLVDGDKEIVIDTVYGTGVDSYDTCRFLYYDDFVKYRTERIKLHYWYKNDTVYYFAHDSYVARYNYCRYKQKGNSDLFIRFNDPVTHTYRYIEIPVSRRIHLHDFRAEIQGRLPASAITSMQGLIMEVDRKEWNLPDK